MTPTDSPRRRRWLFVPAGLLLAAAVVPIDTGVERELWRTLGDALHAPLLAAVALLLLAALPRTESPRRTAIIAALASIAIAAAVEIGQPSVGRSASLVDAVNGTLGAGAAIVGWLAWTRGGAAARAAHAVLCLAVLVAVSMPAWVEWRAIRWRATHRPLIADFETRAEMPLWSPLGAGHGTSIGRTAGPVAHGSRALEILTAPGGWSGVSYAAGRSDWRAWHEFDVELYNAEQRIVELTVRIDDHETNAAYDSRFNAAFELEPGWNRISIPLATIRDSPKDRPLDLSRIRRVLFFVAPRTPATRLRLDHVRLR